jgi:hypothetical protein
VKGEEVPICTKCGKKYSALTSENLGAGLCNSCLDAGDSSAADRPSAAAELPKLVRVYGRYVLPILGALGIAIGVALLGLSLMQSGDRFGSIGGVATGALQAALSLVVALAGGQLGKGKRQGVYILVILSGVAVVGAVVGVLAGVPALSAVVIANALVFYIPPMVSALSSWKRFS